MLSPAQVFSPWREGTNISQAPLHHVWFGKRQREGERETKTDRKIVREAKTGRKRDERERERERDTNTQRTRDIQRERKRGRGYAVSTRKKVHLFPEPPHRTPSLPLHSGFVRSGWLGKKWDRKECV